MGFRYGQGSGLEGSNYNREWPQGQFGYASCGQKTKLGGILPYWTKDPARRAHVLLVFFERRANKSLKTPPGDFSTRLETVKAKMEAARLEEIRLIKERADLEWNGCNNGRDSARLNYLEGTGEFTAWANAVLTDYFFDAADHPDEPYQSWDAGQCAWMHGNVYKIFVKQLIRKVNKIGEELYPAPKAS
jgi:hypothetical protein